MTSSLICPIAQASMRPLGFSTFFWLLLCQSPHNLRRILQRNDGSIDRPGDLHPVMQDRHHQLAMVTHDRALTGDEREGLCPPQTNTNVELTNPGFLVDTAWIAGYIQTRNTHFACHPCDR